MTGADTLERKQVGSLRVSEIFGPTIQGEGAQIGRPTVFVRLGGCDYRCSWCDTPYAVLPEHRHTWTKTSPGEVIAQVEALSVDPILVTLSGGNPALQPCAELIKRGQDRGHTFTMETQGSVARDWFAQLDHLCLSPKPPSSGMTTDYAKLDSCMLAAGPADTILKVVIFDEADLQYARDVSARYPRVPIYLQVGNPDPTGTALRTHGLLVRLEWLATLVVQERWYEARVLPQLHTLLWGNARGV